VAIYPIEIASNSFAMTLIDSSSLNATWYKVCAVRIKDGILIQWANGDSWRSKLAD